VKTTRALLEELLDEARIQAARWRTAVQAADRAEAALAGTDVALAFGVDPRSRAIDFRGYAYSRKRSEASGGSYIVYDETRPQIWKVNLHDGVRPTITARAPHTGYVIPAADAGWVARKLAQHGIRSERLPVGFAGTSAVFRAQGVTFASKPFEGRFSAKVTGAWSAERRSSATGDLLVPIAQPRARLLMHLLEPTGPDSLVAWGYFHTAFEEKPAMETYVAEEQAHLMMAEGRFSRSELEAALKKDPTLAADPRRRLNLFRRRHPSWDDRQNLYPIWRIERRR
jgi:hypothetical protein